MSDQNLTQLLSQLHKTLQDHPQLDDETRTMLDQISNDVAALNKDQNEHQALSDKLEQQAVEFEQAHPTLSEILRQIVDTLGRIGV